MQLVSLVKKSKKEQKKAHAAKRNTWNVNPVTRIVPNKKAYKRDRKIEME